MIPDDTRKKIENIVSGVIIEGQADTCTTIRNLLCRRFATSTTVKDDFESRTIIKEEQARLIKVYCDAHGLWVDEPQLGIYLTRGGEAKVYLHTDRLHVVKLNDAIYYTTWLEFLNSILLHNLIFDNTAYELLGFRTEDSNLFAVLKQVFVTSDTQVEIDDIRKFLEFNGFENNRRNDYINKKLGLILEDMHDENVLVNSEALFFIDSVFYTVAPQK
jgi:hypothetical protein